MKRSTRFIPNAVCCLALLASGVALWAQQYVISTIAGGAPPPTPVAALNASFGLAWGVAAGPDGNLYVSGDNCVFKVDLNGILTRVAGTSRLGYSGDADSARALNCSIHKVWR